MIDILPLQDSDLSQFKKDMQQAFKDSYGDELPERYINDSLQKPGAIAYTVVENGGMVGGAIVVIDETDRTCGDLDFLYVKSGTQSRGVGQATWAFIEKTHNQVKLWRLLTPYVAVKNLHFYINRLGFAATEFFCEKHPNPHFPEYATDLMLHLEKRIR